MYNIVHWGGGQLQKSHQDKGMFCPFELHCPYPRAGKFVKIAPIMYKTKFKKEREVLCLKTCSGYLFEEHWKIVTLVISVYPSLFCTYTLKDDLPQQMLQCYPKSLPQIYPSHCSSIMSLHVVAGEIVWLK